MNTEKPSVEFETCSRQQAETQHIPGEHYLISIYTDQDTPAALAKNALRLDTLVLCFDDINTEQIVRYPGTVKNHHRILFNEALANQVLDFVAKYAKDGARFVIHCDAGISRSPGMAAALDLIYGNDNSRWFKFKLPNSLVYNTLLKVWMDNNFYDPTVPQQNRYTPEKGSETGKDSSTNG